MIRSVLKRALSEQRKRQLKGVLERFGYRDRYLKLRDAGFQKLRGKGIEIGAFEHPAPLPKGCVVEYVDAITPEQAAALFPEIDAAALMPVTHLIDVDRDGLQPLANESQDFAIACHVIEHLANPGRFVAELLRVLRPGGLLVIAAPDHRFCFDRTRPLTQLETLEGYYQHGRPAIGPEDYREMLEHVHPEIARGPKAEIQATLEALHRRREHLSVWTSASFRDFLTAAFGWAGGTATPEYEVHADQNQFEYFGVWRKG